jgi:hypothetical protein
LGDFGVDDLLGVARAKPRLNHGRRVDIDLNLRMAAGQHVALKVRRNIHDEGVLAHVHQVLDVALGKRDGRLEVGHQKRVAYPPRQFGLIFVNDPDRRVIQLLGIALRLADHGEREGIDHQTQQHPVA